MEDHFDKSVELESSLEARGKTALLELIRPLHNLAHITYTRQAEPLGLGHAVLQAKALVGDEPVAGMTDAFLMRTYERLFSPRMGSVFDRL